MRTKYTPGKWAQAHRENKDGMYNTEVYSVDTGETIATIAWCPMPPRREIIDGESKVVVGSYREANAKLIHAAPDLVEALSNLFDKTQTLIEYTADQGFIDWEDETNLGVINMENAKKMAIEALTKATE